jgi:hypothetical protein
MHVLLPYEYARIRHADLLREARAYRAAAAYRPRRTRRGPLARRRAA